MMDCDIAIIGAGPSGAMAAKLLLDRGYSVTVLEASQFPRFSIGESLLPYCLELLDEAGLLDAIDDPGYQYKNGAAFARGSEYCAIDFRKKYEGGHGTAWQVKRADFDQNLINAAEKSGANVIYNARVTAFREEATGPVLDWTDKDGKSQTCAARFVFDASGFGRVLPRLLDLEKPSDFPVRQAIFTHIRDGISAGTYDETGFDRDKILITINPTKPEIWYWLIPFPDGTSSLGVVLPDGLYADEDKEALLWRLAAETALGPLLDKAETLRPVASLHGYSANVTRLAGDSFALLGNAAEFLDPVFSSGVTIGLQSAALAVPVLHRHLQGKDVDWATDYEAPLRKGINVFRVLVEEWYKGPFQQVIMHHPEDDPNLKKMIVSVLAGYAWNQDNPLVRSPARALRLAHELSVPQPSGAN